MAENVNKSDTQPTRNSNVTQPFSKIQHHIKEKQTKEKYTVKQC